MSRYTLQTLWLKQMFGPKGCIIGLFRWALAFWIAGLAFEPRLIYLLGALRGEQNDTHGRETITSSCAGLDRKYRAGCSGMQLDAACN